MNCPDTGGPTRARRNLPVLCAIVGS
ncbi:hypothetical protein LEMLEM_LOCUS11225 [Lemmus lemmus]